MILAKKVYIINPFSNNPNSYRPNNIQLFTKKNTTTQKETTKLINISWYFI